MGVAVVPDSDESDDSGDPGNSYTAAYGATPRATPRAPSNPRRVEISAAATGPANGEGLVLVGAGDRVRAAARFCFGIQSETG